SSFPLSRVVLARPFSHPHLCCFLSSPSHPYPLAPLSCTDQTAVCFLWHWSVGFPPLGVTQHPALRSPDFPPAASPRPATVQPSLALSQYSRLRGCGRRRQPAIAPRARASTRSFMTSPEWPATLCQTTSWRRVSARMRSQRSRLATACFWLFRQPFFSQRSHHPSRKQLTMYALSEWMWTRRRPGIAPRPAATDW